MEQYTFINAFAITIFVEKTITVITLNLAHLAKALELGQTVGKKSIQEEFGLRFLFCRSCCWILLLQVEGISSFF
jgi:hypothetical protein